MKVSFVFLLACIHGFCLSQSFRDTASFAQEQYKAKNYDGALSSYQSAQQIQVAEKNFENEKEMATELGQAAYRSGNYDQAIENFEKALKKETKPENRGVLYYNLGNANYKSGNTQKAIEYYKEGVKVLPKDLEMKYNLSQLLRKKAAQNKENKDQNQKSENSKSEPNDGPEQKPKPSKYSFEEQQKQKLLNDLLKDAANTKRRLEKNKNDASTKAKDW